MIVIHIGLRKAGSASLQAFLSANEEGLRSLGMEYPRIGRIGPSARTAHVNLASDLRGRRQFDPEYGTLSQLAEYWRACDAQILILSSEMFEDCDTDEALRLKTILRRGDEPFRIVLILRDLIALMPSSYAQKIKYGANTYDFDSFFAQRITQPRVNYFKTANRWAKAFGWENMRVRLLDPAHLKNGDVKDDFLDVLGLDAGDDEAVKGFARPDDINLSPGWRVLETVRALYTDRHRLPEDHLFADAAWHGQEQRRMFGNLAMAAGDQCGWNADKGRYMNRSQAQACLDLYGAAIERLNNRLADRLPTPEGLDAAGFQDRAFLPDAGHIPPADLREFYDRLVDMPGPADIPVDNEV